MALPEVQRPPETLADVELLGNLTRAEDSIRRGLTGERLQRLIDFLAFSQTEGNLIVTYVDRINGLEPVVTDLGYL